jgi:general secretion pathway protein M
VAIKLNKREKYYVSAALGFIIVFTLMQLIVFPSLEKRTRLKRTVEANANRIQQLYTLSTEYNLLREQADRAQLRLSKREAGFSLFSFLDGLVSKNGLKDQISYMKPSSSEGPNSQFKISTVEMKLQAITLEQLTQYLCDVENSMKSALVKRISISEMSKQEGLLDVVLQVETLEAS